MEVDSTVVKVAPIVDETVWGDFVLNGTDSVVIINKELFNGDGTITFTEGSDTRTEVRGSWSNTLLTTYKQLVELRKAMNFYFFVDGVMKDDVSEVSEGLRESVDFSELFDLCETINDKSMAYYCSYFIEITLDTPRWGNFKFPLCYLRHFNGTYYAELLGTIIVGDDDERDDKFDQSVPLIDVKRFDMDFYFAFCELRTRLNGKMFVTCNKLQDVVIAFLDKYTYEVIGQAIKFGNSIGDAHGSATDLMDIDFHQVTEVCGCYFSSLVGDEKEFDVVNDVVTRADKPATKLLRGGEDVHDDIGSAVGV